MSKALPSIILTAGEPAGIVERKPVSSLGIQIHGEHQRADELLACGDLQSGRMSFATGESAHAAYAQTRYTALLTEAQ